MNYSDFFRLDELTLDAFENMLDELSLDFESINIDQFESSRIFGTQIHAHTSVNLINNSLLVECNFSDQIRDQIRDYMSVKIAELEDRYVCRIQTRDQMNVIILAVLK